MSCLLILTGVLPVGLAGLVGLVWLLVLGQWRFSLALVVASLAFQFLVGPLLMGAYKLPLVAWSGKLRGRAATAVLYVGQLLDSVVGVVWVIVVLAFAQHSAGVKYPLPYLLLGWEAAAGPFQFWASKEEPDNVAAQSLVVFTAAVYLVLALLVLIGAEIWVFPAAAVLLVTMQVWLGVFVTRIAKGDS